MAQLPDLSPAEIKVFRAGLGLSQVGLADLLDVSRPAVEKWEKVGAPAHWRYVFAAISLGIKPWGGRPVGDRIDRALVQSRDYRLPNSDAPFALDYIGLTTKDFEGIFAEPVPDGPSTLRPMNNQQAGDYRGRKLIQESFLDQSRLVGHCGKLKVTIPID